MDYEKKYKDALETARDYYKADKILANCDEIDVLEDIFPELKESEDERIEYIEFQDDAIETTHEQISNDKLVELIKQRLGGGK